MQKYAHQQDGIDVIVGERLCIRSTCCLQLPMFVPEREGFRHHRHEDQDARQLMIKLLLRVSLCLIVSVLCGSCTSNVLKKDKKL